jgi:hypothetical protein
MSFSTIVHHFIKAKTMRKTISKIALSVIILTFAACGSSNQQKAETAPCCFPHLTCVTDESTLRWDGEAELQSGSQPLGNGGQVGDFNITLYRSKGTAFLELIKSNGLGIDPTVIKKVNLSTHTGLVTLDRFNNVVVNSVSGHAHDSTMQIIGHGDLADFKISLSNPLANGAVGPVGAEDPRNGVSGGRGTHNVFNLNNGHIRISQNNASTLRVSMWSGATLTEFADTTYCNGMNSTSGVEYWGRKFQYQCN